MCEVDAKKKIKIKIKICAEKKGGGDKGKVAVFFSSERRW